MRPGIGRNASCASGDWLTSRPKGCSQPRELWFFDMYMYMYICVEKRRDKIGNCVTCYDVSSDEHVYTCRYSHHL